MERLNAEANGNSRQDIVERLRETDQRLNDIKAQEDSLRQELAAVVEKERQRGSDIPALIREREENRYDHLGRGDESLQLIIGKYIVSHSMPALQLWVDRARRSAIPLHK